MAGAVLLPVLRASTFVDFMLSYEDDAFFVAKLHESIHVLNALAAGFVSAASLWRRDEVLAVLRGLHHSMRPSAKPSPRALQRVTFVAAGAALTFAAVLFLTVYVVFCNRILTSYMAVPNDVCNMIFTSVRSVMAGAFAFQVSIVWALGADLRVDAERLVADAVSRTRGARVDAWRWRRLRVRQSLLRDLQASSRQPGINSRPTGRALIARMFTRNWNHFSHVSPKFNDQ